MNLLNTEREQLQNVQERFSSLKTLPAHVPTVIGVSDDGFCLLLSPVAHQLAHTSESLESLVHSFLKTGSPFFGSCALLCSDHIVSVVNLLRLLHTHCQVAHRDLKLNNIFLKWDKKTPKVLTPASLDVCGLSRFLSLFFRQRIATYGFFFALFCSFLFVFVF
jgi:serine/threonine protein kinase